MAKLIEEQYPHCHKSIFVGRTPHAKYLDLARCILTFRATLCHVLIQDGC